VRLEETLRDDLWSATAAPDLTEPIMRRLGYVQLNERQAARRRHRHAATRIALSIAGGLIIAVAASVYRQGDGVRKPVGTTVPEALREDLNRQQERLDRTIRTIRGWRPAVAPAPETELDRYALGPVRFL
jgi:hypothetical protein